MDERRTVEARCLLWLERWCISMSWWAKVMDERAPFSDCFEGIEGKIRDRLYGSPDGPITILFRIWPMIS